MTTTLLYGKDAVGKSSQLKSICEASENPIILSTELKNRKLYNLNALGKMQDESPEVVECIVLDDTYLVDPVESFRLLGKTIERIINGFDSSGKKTRYTTVVIDGISDISKWAEKVTIKEIQKTHPDQKVIGEKNLAGWSMRNNLTCLPMERLSAWAVVNESSVFFSTLMSSEYLAGTKVGYKVDIQDRVRDKACDIRIKLEKTGKGYTATFEKEPDHSKKGDAEVLVQKGGLYLELVKRGLI